MLMKICPQCQTTYTDDNLKFCLQDGAPLRDQTVSQNRDEAETLVSPKNYDRTQIDRQNPTLPNWTDSEPTKIIVEPRKSNTGLIIALTSLITLLVAGGGIAGYLFYRNNEKIETAQNTNLKISGAPASNTANNSQKSNANIGAPPSPTATPTAKPTLDPKLIEAVKGNVKNALDDWANSTENHDIDAHLDSYADTVDYYNAGQVSSARVRADREKAFAAYDNLEVNLSNIKITPDATGEKATAVLDKEWNFSGDAKSNSGAVQQQLTLAKIGGKWLITGEKDLKVYYVNK